MKSSTARAVLFTVAALAFGCKLALALNTYGSNDIATFQAHAARIRGAGALDWYRNGVNVPIPGGRGTFPQAANFPPFLIQMLRAWDYLARISGLTFGFWLRFTCVVADIGTLLLVRGILSVSGRPARLAAVLLVAFSPVSIMISGFHGNTDPLMILFVLLSIYLVEKGNPLWLAGMALGLAASVKIIALLFVPVFVLYLTGLKRRVEFTLAVGAIAIVLALPYLAQAPMLIMKRTLGYSSNPDIWGLSQLGAVFLPAKAYALYRATGKAIAIVPVVWASYWVNCRPRKPSLFMQCGLVAFLFLFLAPAFGVQYLAWLVPWGAGLSNRESLPFWVVSSLYLFACYTALSGGIPWYLANAFKGFQGYWPGVIVWCLGVACWITVGGTAYAFWRRLAPGGIDHSEGHRASA